MQFYSKEKYREKNLAIGWYDISNRIKNQTALTFSQNITEFWVQELSYYPVKIHIDNDPNNILHWAADNNVKYLIVVAIGNNLSERSNFIDSLVKYIDDNPNFTILGHILDKKDQFYELHHQCFVVNITWWQSVNKPEIGFEHRGVTWETIQPYRSEENWHDDYTPHWINQGTVSKSYIGRKFGWNIIKKAIEYSEIKSFNQDLRRSKYYIYPEVSDTFTKWGNIIDDNQFYLHFAANTETYEQIRLPENGFKGVICTAGGITPLLISWRCKLKPGNKVIVFDASPLALKIQKTYISSKSNFKDIKKDFYDVCKHIDPTDEILKIMKATSNLDIFNKQLDYWRKTSDLNDFIENVWPKLEFRFHNKNIFYQDISWCLDWFDQQDNVFLHLSNIFHYHGSSWLYNSESRYAIERDLLEKLAVKGAERIYINNTRPGINMSWLGNTPKEILSKPEIYLQKTKELDILPWIKK